MSGEQQGRECGDVNPHLPLRPCEEPAGHDGIHLTNDGCGRPEYTWVNHYPPASSPRQHTETVEEMAARTGWPVELLNARVAFRADPAPSSTPPARDSGRDEAREAVARWLLVHDGSAPWAWDRLLNDKSRALWRTYADELLALPELAALFTEPRQPPHSSR